LSNAHIVDKILNDHNNCDLRELIKLVVVFDGTHNHFLPFSQLLSEGKNEKLRRIPHFDANPKKDLFVIVYSSGTTGLPNGAMITHYNAVAGFKGFNTYFNVFFGFNLRIAGIYPFGHINGAFCVPNWISDGNTIVLYDVIDEELIFQSVEKYRLDMLLLFPAFGYRTLDEH
jgi:long-subunit acyl-CoA synthetase (AMP-forming)